MTPIYFLSLLVVVYGGLTIDIDVSSDPPFIDVRNSISTNVISDDERVTFGIQDAELKKAVANYTNDNTVPDFVYVKKTGEKNDLYAHYTDFQEIKRTVKPKYVDADIKYHCSEPKSNVTTKIKTDWSITGTLTIPDNITHIVYFDRDQKTEVYSAWGRGVVFKTIPVPGDHVQLCKMTVTIEYEITIAGDVAADYTKPRKSTSTDDNSDHHYYAYNVFNVQNAAGLPKSVIWSETITVIYPKKKETHVSGTTATPITSSTV